MSQVLQVLTGLRVLVVDDTADDREFAIAVLSTSGIEVRAVASGVEAFKELERFCPDVLLINIRTPGDDGYSLIRQIRALEAERGGHIAAAAITAYTDGDRQKSLEAGFEAHLHKLALPEAWIEMVRGLAQHTSR